MVPRAIAAATAMVLSAAPARADLTAACLSSYEQAQIARKDARLRRAREQLLVCSQSGCPAATRADCIPWLAEVEKAMPSVVITARDSEGKELVDARVSFDGAPLATKLDGRPLPVDPGEHTLRLEANGHRPVEQRVVIHEAEKDRPLAFTFVEPVVAPETNGSVAAPPPTSSSARPDRALHPGPPVYALGAVTLVALGSFAYFGVTGVHDANHLRDVCYPHCSDTADVTSANRELLVADVSLGVAVVAAAIAIYLLVAVREPPPRAGEPAGILRF